MNKQLIITVFLSIINILAIMMMFWDKQQSILGGRRISERTLFLLAFCFGGSGILLGMFCFHHKTNKWYFALTIPFIIVLNWYLLLKLFY